MLTESFISATLISEKTKTKTKLNKDASIHHYDFQPLQALKGSFKKSSAQQNCLAVSASHVFAAQSDKSVIHVYSRDRGSQEAVVPFHDRIRSIALAADADGAGVLVLGTEGGGVILWEVRCASCSGVTAMLTATNSSAPVVKYPLHHLTYIRPHVWRSTRHRTLSYPDPPTRMCMSGPSHRYWHSRPRTITTQIILISLALSNPSRITAPP